MMTIRDRDKESNFPHPTKSTLYIKDANIFHGYSSILYHIVSFTVRGQNTLHEMVAMYFGVLSPSLDKPQ